METKKLTTAKTRTKKELGRRKNGQSIMNNFNSIKDTKANAAQAKFFLKELSKATSMKEQGLIVDLILAGFELSPKYEEYREKIRLAWQNTASSNPLF